MYLESLHLKNFRNFADEHVELDPHFNLLIGMNAQGKTNIVEAVGLLATGRSFRTSEFRDMIRSDCEAARVTASSSGSAGSDELRVNMDPAAKIFYRNSKRSRPGGFVGLGTVIFAPEEIILLRDSPSARRRHIDGLIAQLSPSYRGVVGRYERVVSHRNRLLQEGLPPPSLERELAAWDGQLIELGTRISVERSHWCERLNGIIPHKYAAIAPQDASALFLYRPHCGEEAVKDGEAAVRKALELALAERRPDEIDRGTTLVGPHRDDLEARIGDAAVRHFGSQGQHRSFVLALKIAEMELLREALGDEPILLLDDVASELDSERSRFLFDYLGNVAGQVFVTATDAGSLWATHLSGAKRFEVASGHAMAL
ncbi:MAG: DNA replication/repair protein RecF [Pseudomonadota bacterium]